MTDKELLELAAKAAGYIPVGEPEEGNFLVSQDGNSTYWVWNPLHSDAQALRLAVKLNIDIEFWLCFEEVKATPQKVPVDPEEQPFGDDPYAATRRAIVRAAAAIGETL